MDSIVPNCSYCEKPVVRAPGRVNESKKRGWRVFCSNKCIGLSLRKSAEYVCAREGCGKHFIRTPSKLNKSGKLYCSCRCSVIVNNKTHPRNPGIVKICAFCGNSFKSRDKYCSKKCKDLGSVIPENILLDQIKNFVNKNERIPYKYEIPHYHAFRGRFGTWNKAIEAAGFKPNPVMFAKKYIAKDGDKCDSLAEKIIDDFLSRRNIKHTRNFSYPGNQGFTVDFKVGENWIEFFGLSGELKRYDELKDRKLKLARRYNLKIIEIYPKDIFPLNGNTILPLELLFR